MTLHDIVLTDPASWTPQTTAWWVVLGITVILSAWIAAAAAGRRRRNRYRKLALTRLARIEMALANPASRAEAATALPVLVKQTALAFTPRSDVAGLSGTSWLQFLDNSYTGSEFSEGPGQLLVTLAYSTPATRDRVPTVELEALVNLVRQWIRSHRVRV